MDASTTTSEKDKRAKGMELLQSHAGKGKSWKKVTLTTCRMIRTRIGLVYLRRCQDISNARPKATER